ncbi:hypothetical protein D0T57_05450 [Dysgonomonas sp. 511]|nr:hypothetical protein [Dysgonomonas sp. 511]
MKFSKNRSIENGCFTSEYLEVSLFLLEREHNLIINKDKSCPFQISIYNHLYMLFLYTYTTYINMVYFTFLSLKVKQFSSKTKYFIFSTNQVEGVVISGGQIFSITKQVFPNLYL